MNLAEAMALPPPFSAKHTRFRSAYRLLASQVLFGQSPGFLLIVIYKWFRPFIRPLLVLLFLYRFFHCFDCRDNRGQFLEAFLSVVFVVFVGQFSDYVVAVLSQIG